MAKFTGLNKEIQAAGGRRALGSTAPEVSQVFPLPYLDTFRNIYNDKQEALPSFKE